MNNLKTVTSRVKLSALSIAVVYTLFHDNSEWRGLLFEQNWYFVHYAKTCVAQEKGRSRRINCSPGPTASISTQKQTLRQPRQST
jgi:hypothetical protein